MTKDQIPNAKPAPLPAKSAFVIHLVGGPDGLESVQGRIEHITTGRAIRFASVGELIGFMQRTMAQQA